MKKIKMLVCLLLSSLIILGLTGCTNKSSGDADKSGNGKGSDPIVIKYPTFQVGVNTSAPVLKKNVEEFNKKYEGKIKVEIEEIPGDQAYVDKMKVLLSANELPDLVYAGGYNLLDPALERNAVIDLTPYLDANPEWKALFDEQDLEFNSRDSKIYSLPEEKQIIGYYYNKALFKKANINEPPKTWDEFFEDCEKLKAAGIVPLSMDTADSGWLTSLWLNSIIGTSGESGNKFMNTSNISDYNTPEFIDAVGKIQKMFQEYTTSDAIGGKYENGANNFFSGQTAMIANGPWMIGDLQSSDKVSKEMLDNIGMSIYPEQGVFDAPMLGYFVTAKDKERQEAVVEFLKYLTSKETQLRSLEMMGRIPTTPNIEISDEIAKKHPLIIELINASKDAKYKYNDYQSLWYPNVLDGLSTNYPSLATGNMTPQEFAKVLTEIAAKNE